MRHYLYDYSNIYLREGIWYRICPRCKRHNQTTTKNAAMTLNRNSRGCRVCRIVNGESSPLPPRVKTAPDAKPDANIHIFEKDGKVFRTCRRCGKMVECVSRPAAEAQDKNSIGCKLCAIEYRYKHTIKQKTLQPVDIDRIRIETRVKADEYFKQLEEDWLSGKCSVVE